MSASIWDWYHSYAGQIYEDDQYGRRHVEMLERFEQGIQEEDPRYNVSCIRRARRISESLGEDLFTLWCDVWIGQELASLGDLKKTREILAAAALRARQRKYNGTPQQMMANVKLITTLAVMDPLGYQDQIGEAVQYVKEHCGPVREHAVRAHWSSVCVAIELQDWAVADRLIDQMQELLAVEDPDDLWSIGYARAKIACLCKSWPEMLAFADQGVREGKPDKEAKGSLALARACALAALGEPKPARTEYRRGWRLRDSLADGDDYLFSTWYWINLGDLPGAIEVRLKQQAQIENKGRYWEQAQAAQHLVELYSEIGERAPAARWRRALARYCKDLRAPAPFQAALAGLPKERREGDAGL